MRAALRPWEAALELFDDLKRFRLLSCLKQELHEPEIRRNKQHEVSHFFRFIDHITITLHR